MVSFIRSHVLHIVSHPAMKVAALIHIAYLAVIVMDFHGAATIAESAVILIGVAEHLKS